MVSKRRAGFRFRAGLLVLALAFPVSAHANDASLLYQTQAIVTGQSEENRQPGFEKCFQDVLVKVSGDQRLLKMPEVIALVPRSGEFVASFRYRDRLEGIPIHDEQGTYDRPHDLTCVFDRAKIDALLAELGSKPWLEPRPKVVIFLAVKDAAREFVLSSDGDESPYMAESFEAASEPLGLAVVVPTADGLASQGLRNEYEEVRVASPELMVRPAKALGGDMPLIGSIRWSAADLGWVALWDLYADGTSFRWSVRGVSFDDAFRNAIRGAAQVLSGNGQPD